MSLVQEALKRKAAETETPAGTPPPEDTGTKGVPPKQPRRKRGGLKAALLWLFILLLVAGLCYAAFYLFSKGLMDLPFLNGKKAAPTEQATPTPPPLAEADSSKHSTAYNLIKKTKDIATEEVAMEHEVAALIPTEKQPAALPPETLPTAIPSPQPKEPIALPTPIPTPIPTEEQPAPPPPTPKEVNIKLEPKKDPVEWPPIRLSGVITKADPEGSGLAFLDGEILSCGQRIEGVKLISVQSDGVVLEYKGEIKTLRVGSEMY